MLRRLCIFWLWAAQVPLQVLSGQPAPNPWLSEDAILVANNGIRVPLGRAAFVDPVNDLVLQTRPGDRCGVTVLDDGPPGRRPGRLSPEKFPCDFGPRDVKYTHYGSEIPAGHRVRLQLRYDTGGQSVVVPFTVEVEVVFARLELVAKNAPLSVRRPRGTSDAIDRSILDFAYDRESHKCGVTRLADGGRRPRYGRLLDGGKLAQMMDCDELTRAGVRYRHTSRGTFPDRDAVPMVAELRDRGGNVARREHFHLTVRIAGGRENTAPGPSLLAMMTMEVSQSAMTAFTTEMLAADDAESDPGDLLFNITSWPSLEEGYVVSTDDQNSPIASFYQRDLRDLKIAYKPPSLDADADVIFQLEFQVLDPDGAASDPFAFTVVVKPMNWLAPAPARNAGQLLYEGQSRPLTTDNLEIADADDLGAVSVRVLGGPRHGVLLVRGTRRDGFAAPDLAAGAVVYRHDGSDAYSDNVVLEMTDGRHHVDFLFPITVVPVDDEAPVVESNGGLVVFHGQTRAVPALALGATDVDSEDATVRFTVVPPFSAIGATLLRQSDAPEDPSSWKFNSEEEVYEKEVREWLQKDITDGNLFYRHVGPRVATAIADKVVFTLRDDNDPPNESGRVTFVIRVLPVDDMAPEFPPGATVEEYELRPRDLSYSWPSLPFVLFFYAADIDAPSMFYVLRKEEKATWDVFHFSAEDKAGKTFRDDRCRISLEKDLGGGASVNMVLRRGFSGKTTFVGVATEDRSAKKGRGCRGNFQKAVRFDPGQTGASGRIRILADGKYDRPKTLRILLSEPAMAALEFPAAATVVILDPHDGQN